MAFSLSDILRYLHGGDKKQKAAFSTEKEAYDFCRGLYNKSGGVSPELVKAYEFYQKNFDDGCEHYNGPESTQDFSTEFTGKRTAV